MDIKSIFSNFIDFVSVLFKTKFILKTKFPNKEHNILRILGNGNSLNETNYYQSDVDYMVVNRHILSDSYEIIRPKFYVLADPHFFFHEEGISVLYKIIEKTYWNITIFVPYNKQIRKFLNSVNFNKNIHFVYFNSVPYPQSAFFSSLFYNKQLAMPVVQNVMVACIMLGIQLRYKTIELFGVDHNWTKHLFVGNDNVVYLENPHFFDKCKIDAKPVMDIQHTDDYPLYLILSQYSRMFQSYWEIKQYIIDASIDVSIYNMCNNSFIDAFVKPKV